MKREIFTSLFTKRILKPEIGEMGMENKIDELLKSLEVG